jgi:hypothetical protein
VINSYQTLLRSKEAAFKNLKMQYDGMSIVIKSLTRDAVDNPRKPCKRNDIYIKKEI